MATSTAITIVTPQCVKDSDPEVQEAYTAAVTEAKKNKADCKDLKRKNIALEKHNQIYHDLHREHKQRLPYRQGDRVIYNYGKVIWKGRITKVNIIYTIEDDDSGKVLNHCNAKFVKLDNELDD